MKSKDFLRSKGILSNDSDHFIIDFHDGREINLGDLLEEYAQQSQPSGMRWGIDSPFPLLEIIKRLSGAVEYLLHRKDYDGPDYEELQICIKEAKKFISESSPAGADEVKNSTGFVSVIQNGVANFYPAGAAKGASEGMAEALRQISEMSDPGSPELAIVRMKQIASKALPPGVEDGSGWVKGGKEYIVCAAIQYFVDDKEVIVCGLRHNNCIGTYYDLTGKQTNSELEQGFLTSKGRFVNRIEAGEIALSCGQIKEMKCYGGKMLDSSDLYHSSPLPTPLGVEDNQTKC